MGQFKAGITEDDLGWANEIIDRREEEEGIVDRIHRLAEKHFKDIPDTEARLWLSKDYYDAFLEEAHGDLARINRFGTPFGTLIVQSVRFGDIFEITKL